MDRFFATNFMLLKTKGEGFVFGVLTNKTSDHKLKRQKELLELNEELGLQVKALYIRML